MKSTKLAAVQICLALLSIWFIRPLPSAAESRAPRAGEAPGCISPGWFPTEFGLKDHTVFWHDGYYYLLSTYVPPNNPSTLVQDRFVYARSSDLCSWEELPPLIAERVLGTWDEAAVWAPHVYEEGGVYYLFYTGVTQDGTQSILLATSTEPDDPASWQKQALVFQPTHPGSLWETGSPADCRDPFVMKHAGQYYLYYTGLDIGGGVIAVATANSPEGPWMDWGSIVSPARGQLLESPLVVQYDRYFYMVYNLPNTGEYYRVGDSPTGAWQDPVPLLPGWAHEIWQTPGGEWMTSYLTDYSVTIARLVWADYNEIPQPGIQGWGRKIYLPLVRNNNN